MEACRVAEKEGLLGGLSWVTTHRVLDKECSAAQGDRSAKEPVCLTIAWLLFLGL